MTDFISIKTYRLVYPLTTVFIQSILLLLLLVPIVSRADETAAIAVVEELHSTLIDTLKNAKTLGFQGRYEKLQPVIQSRFDTPLIAKVILSRYWSELNKEKQTEFIRLFNRLSTATYASRFDNFEGQTFKTLSVQKLKKERLLVDTELQSPGEDPVKLQYLVHQNGDNWYIISVIANGVNDLSLKRAEYANIINEKGFDNLVKELENKVEELGGSTASS